MCSGAELITRRRKWSPTQKAALLEEVEDEGGKVAVVAQRHGISESLLYNWRSAWKAAASVPGSGGLGVFNAAWDSLPALDAWADRGTAPSSQSVIDANAATAGRTRPLCDTRPGQNTLEGVT